jgi:hypothetical protein
MEIEAMTTFCLIPGSGQGEGWDLLTHEFETWVD